MNKQQICIGKITLLPLGEEIPIVEDSNEKEIYFGFRDYKLSSHMKKYPYGQNFLTIYHVTQLPGMKSLFT